MLKRLAWGLCVVLLAAGGWVYPMLRTATVDLPAAEGATRAGLLLHAERTVYLPDPVVRGLLAWAELPEPVETRFGIITYRIEYLSESTDGSLQPLSALVAFPDNVQPRSWVLYFHGTNTRRQGAPSEPGLGEGLLVAAAMSGNGHLLVAPDYEGMGLSTRDHPYLHRAATAAAGVNALAATAQLNAALTVHAADHLFVTGVSQGGHAALAAQAALQTADALPSDMPPLRLRATAPIVGPFQLRDMSFPHALSGKADSHALYLAYLALAYARIYGQPLEELLKPEVAAQARGLFDGNHGAGEIMDALPEDPREMFQADFLALYDAGGEHWFLQALAENSVPVFAPQAPVRFYVGEADLDVLPEESRYMARRLAGLGPDVSVQSVGNFGHAQTAMRALPRIIDWFDALLRQAALDAAATTASQPASTDG